VLQDLRGRSRARTKSQRGMVRGPFAPLPVGLLRHGGSGFMDHADFWLQTGSGTALVRELRLACSLLFGLRWTRWGTADRRAHASRVQRARERCFWHGPEYCCGRMRIRSVTPHLALLNLARIQTSLCRHRTWSRGDGGRSRALGSACIECEWMCVCVCTLQVLHRRVVGRSLQGRYHQRSVYTRDRRIGLAG
jgi:hypothetical protein